LSCTSSFVMRVSCRRRTDAGQTLLMSDAT
jgi:hypothetical protein